MLRLVTLAAQVLILALAAYNAITALWGWKERSPAPSGPHRMRLRVVIPAHNEEGVIAKLLGDLRANSYQNSEIWVLADRCTDGTEGIAERFGVRVERREHGPDGKGAALAWLLQAHPLEPDEAIIIFDADNRVSSLVLERIADELENGCQVVQCYLDVANPEASLVAEASAMSYWAGNRMVQLARSNLGWSADLGGTGMALTARALNKAGGFSQSMTEDQAMGARVVLAGERVEWLHDVRIEDEKPVLLKVAMRQRARWMAGKRATARDYLVPLLGARTPAAWDQALRIIQPGRSFVALLSVAILILSATVDTTWLFPWWLWAIAVVVQLLEPIPFLYRDGIRGRRLARYPLLVLIAAMWLPVRFLSRRVESWYHTPHGGNGSSS